MFFAASAGVIDAFSCPFAELRNGRAIFGALLMFVPSDSARLIGLFGEVLRCITFVGAAFRIWNFDLVLVSGAVSTLKVRDNAEGDRGVILFCLGDFRPCNWKRDGFDGERDRERRICLIDGKGSANLE